MTKGKKIIILVSMALVLIVASVLNVTLLADNSSSTGGNNDTVPSFFESSRADRLATRNYEIEQLNSIIEMEGDDFNRWRWSFRNGTCHEIKPTLIWEDA